MTEALIPNVAKHVMDSCPWNGSTSEPPLLPKGHCGNCNDYCVKCEAVFDEADDTLDWVSGTGLVCEPCRRSHGLPSTTEVDAFFGIVRT